MRQVKGQWLLCLILVLFIGCKQSDPPPEPDFWRDGTMLRFSGFDWEVKVTNELAGPGPNFFSGFEEDIYLDDEGHLHMLINEHDSLWYSSEIVSSQNMGYGTYTFTVEGDFVNLPRNVVVGLFTWDNNTFFEQANSEVDIEFSKWGDESVTSTLQYGVQPINFGTFYPERVYNTNSVETEITGVSTHQFTWTDSLISWQSFTGEGTEAVDKFAEWSFDLNNPARVKEEGNSTSNPIIIPAPGETTNARINFWLLPWIDPAPTDGETQELIIRYFNYTSI